MLNKLSFSLMSFVVMAYRVTFDIVAKSVQSMLLIWVSHDHFILDSLYTKIHYSLYSHIIAAKKYMIPLVFFAWS